MKLKRTPFGAVAFWLGVSVLGLLVALAVFIWHTTRLSQAPLGDAL